MSGGSLWFAKATTTPPPAPPPAPPLPPLLRLTNKEREAIVLAADFLEDEFYGCSDKCASEHNAVDTLRNLLERTK